MKRIEVHHIPQAGKMQWHVYQITGDGGLAHLLVACLTEELANKVKGLLES